MPGTARPDICATGLAVRAGRQAVEHWGEMVVGVAAPARHQAGAVQRALFTTGHPHPDELNPAGPRPPGAALGVGEQRVSRIDDDVARLQHRLKLVEDAVDRRTRLYHQYHHAGACERGDKCGKITRRCEVPLMAESLDQRVRASGMPIVHRDVEAMPRRVPGKVGPHGRETVDSDVARSVHLLHSRH